VRETVLKGCQYLEHEFQLENKAVCITSNNADRHQQQSADASFDWGRLFFVLTGKMQK
jgi:hypothetical protein